MVDTYSPKQWNVTWQRDLGRKSTRPRLGEGWPWDIFWLCSPLLISFKASSPGRCSHHTTLQFVTRMKGRQDESCERNLLWVSSGKQVLMEFTTHLGMWLIILLINETQQWLLILPCLLKTTDKLTQRWKTTTKKVSRISNTNAMTCPHLANGKPLLDLHFLWKRILWSTGIG